MHVGRSYSCISLLSDGALLNAIRKELTTLRKASRALTRLHQSLDTKMHLLERTVTPVVFHRGIEDLPDEILMKILESKYEEAKEESMWVHKAAHTLRDEHENLRQLALVNRRFFNLMCRMPSLWTNMAFDKDGNEKLDDPRVLGSSRNARLDVFATGGPTTVHAFEHANNWASLFAKKFGLIGGYSVWEWKADIVTFPALVDLHMDHTGEFQLYRLPALRRLRTCGNPLKLTPVMSQLTSLSLGITLDAPQDASELISAIALGKGLRRLEFRIFFISAHPFVDANWSQETSCLSMLGMFAMKCMLPVHGSRTERKAAFQAIAAIGRAFVMPNLRSLEVVLENSRRHEPEELSWNDMFPKERDFRHLQSLTFAAVFLRQTTLTWSSDPGPTAKLLPNFLRHFPYVKSLVLSHAELPANCPSDTVAELSKLREITLNKCAMGAHQLEALFLALFEQDVVNVERITIASEVMENTYTCAPVDPIFWMDKLNRGLKGGFCVVCT